jgi:hypothetical protein
MKVGLLWFDNDAQRGIEEKVRRATAHHLHKYGQQPDLCFVHPSMLGGNGEVLRVGEVEVRAGQAILPHHLWIGLDDEKR